MHLLLYQVRIGVQCFSRLAVAFCSGGESLKLNGCCVRVRSVKIAFRGCVDVFFEDCTRVNTSFPFLSFVGFVDV